jgi:ATP-binding cassette, subfamily G (WHITE), member 2, PDR
VSLHIYERSDTNQYRVFQPPASLPGFWIFMYRVSPLTYLVSGITATGLHGHQVECASSETSVLNPPMGQTCGQYLSSFLLQAPGILYNFQATQDCQYCPLRNADQFLSNNGISWIDRWFNFGVVWVYIGFNILATYALYFLFRVARRP